MPAAGKAAPKMKVSAITRSLSIASVLAVPLGALLSMEPRDIDPLKDVGPHWMTRLVVNGQTDTKNPKAKRYNIRPLFIPTDENRFSIVIVSIDSKHFNRDDMTALANELRIEFAKVSRIRAGLVDDDELAQLFQTGRLEVRDFDRAQRGLYYLDRKRCKEYIQFSTRKGQRRSTVTIRFKCPR